MISRIMKTPILPLKHSINRAPFRFGLLVIPLALAWLALSSVARALAVDPPPDGGYPNETTAEGEDALFSLTTGSSNTAMGYHALHNITTGSGHTAVGSEALANLTAGTGCTAIGSSALSNDTFGGNNTAIGAGALRQNTTGYFNTAIGWNTMLFNSTGSYNTATGLYALSQNTTGGANVAYGFGALNASTTGNNNTAIGTDALWQNQTGNDNIALGNFAGFTILRGNSNIDIGNPGLVGRESSTIRIGQTQTNTYIAGISGATVPTGVAVIVGADGHLGTSTSSARYKESIHPMDNASEAILALRPVKFRYKPEVDPAGTPQFGLVAEDVEKVNPDLVARDDEGKPYTVRYEAVNAMLLNEFLKEHSHVREQDAIIARQQKQIEALTAGLQKVSAQLEASKPALQTVKNDD